MASAAVAPTAMHGGNGLWIAGVTVAVLAQFVSNLGSILQKRSHNDEALRPLAMQRPYPKRPLWWVGMALILSGSAADFVALTLAPQSIVATLGCLTLVAQVIWAPLLLGERLSPRHYVATGLILIGVSLAVVYGPRGDAHLALPALLARFGSASLAGYAAVVLAAVAGIWVTVAYVERRFAGLPAKPALVDYVLAPGSANAAACSPACDGRLARFHRVAYGMLSGFAGAQVVLLGKFVGETAAITLSGNTAALVQPALYAVILCLAVSVAGQIYFMNEGVARFQTLYVLPVFQAVWTLTSVLGGLVVYGEWAELGRSTTRKVVFPLGIAVTLFAVYYLMNTPALPESTKRAAFLDKFFGTERPPPDAPPGLQHPSSTPLPFDASTAADGGTHGERTGSLGGVGGNSSSNEIVGGDSGGDLAIRKRGAAAAPTAALPGEHAALLSDHEDAPIDWDRTCNEIWALEVHEGGSKGVHGGAHSVERTVSPSSHALDALAIAAARPSPQPLPPDAGAAYWPVPEAPTDGAFVAGSPVWSAPVPTPK